MQTLIIKDLSVTEALDSKAMSAVHGGFRFAPLPSIRFEDVSQGLQQMQKVENVTASGSAFQDHVDTKNTTKLSGNNNIYFNAL
jgi:hypothetical protein